MIIQNNHEAKRIDAALALIGGCHRFYTPHDCYCENAGMSDKPLNDLCSRLFPKIVKTRCCPCNTYTESYIRRICKKELNFWYATQSEGL